MDRGAETLVADPRIGVNSAGPTSKSSSPEKLDPGFILAIGLALSVVIRVVFCAIGSDLRNLPQENAFSPIVHREPSPTGMPPPRRWHAFTLNNTTIIL